MSIHSEFPESAPSANPVFYRTYSRQTVNGRESWGDVLFRTIEGLTELGDLDEGERCIIRAHMRSQAFFTSGRWLWVGGTDWIKDPKNFFGAYNCTSTDITDMKSFAMLMDMAMQGSGTGAVLDEHCISQLPTIKCHREVEVIGRPGDVPKEERQEETTFEAVNDGFKVVVGDSREGWVNAYYFLLDLEGYTPRKKLRITFDVSHVRPSGESLRGFGGTANPIKLPELFGRIANILNKAIGRKLTAEECCLLIDEAALVVVAGNVRRCLPGDALVHTDRGLVPIKDVKVGDRVQTPIGFRRVVNKFDQGIQDVYGVDSNGPRMRATLNHRVAVYADAKGGYEWKRVSELTEGDRLLHGRQILSGGVTRLPKDFTGARPKQSYTAKDISIPDMTPDIAWLIGYTHGNGYVSVGRNKHNKPYSSVSWSMNSGDVELLPKLREKIERAVESFGLSVCHRIAKTENTSVTKCNSIRLAEYFLCHVKQPKTPLTIPDFILQGTIDVRAAYLAGLADSDGSINNRPPHLVTSIYKDFVRQAAAVLSSLGIAGRLSSSLPQNESWSTRYHLLVPALKPQYNSLIAPHSVKGKLKEGLKMYGFTIPGEMMRESYGYSQMREMGFNGSVSVASNYERYTAESSLSIDIPVTVRSVEFVDTVQTYDIEVEETHCFYCDGYLTHNSAGMRQFDKQHPLLKTNLWQRGEAGDWRIDPERDALRMANHTRVYHHKPTLGEVTEAVRSQFHSGEGAIQYAPEAIARANADLLRGPVQKHSFLKIHEQNPQEARQYLKSLDPAMDNRELDHRMRRFGLNPCLVAGTIVVTRDGNFPIEKLVGKEVEVWDGTQWVVIDNFKVTGENQQVYTVSAGGVKVTATASHRFILGDGSVKLLSELKTGDELMPHYKGELILKNTKIDSIDFSHTADKVYCCTVPTTHRFALANGLMTGNCGEIIGSSFLCNLSEVHLNQLVGSNRQTQEQVFYAAGLSVAALLNHQFVEERYRYSRALDPIVGVSFTGLFDFFVHEFGPGWLKWWAEGRPGEGFRAREKAYLTSWKQAAHDGVRDYCEQRGLKVPNRYTTVQPAGCLDRTALRIFDQGLLYADEIVEPGSGETEGLDLSVRGGIAADTAIANQPLNLVKVTLNNGRVLRMTPNHRLSIDGQWVRADEMAVGMKIDYSLGEYSKTENELLPEFDSILFNEDIAYLLGCIVGSGKVLDDQIVFSFVSDRARSSAIAEKLEGVLTVEFDKYVDKIGEKWQKDSTLVFWFHSERLVQLADSCLVGERLPAFIRKSSRGSILSFFCGLIDSQKEDIDSLFWINLGKRKNFARNLQQVAEAVGLCFALYCEHGDWVLEFFDTWSVQSANEYLQSNSLSCYRVGRLSSSIGINDSEFSKIAKIEPEQTPDYSYDFAIAGADDDDSWYWQGGIKSHNTKSLLTGASPGWHPPKSQRFIRRITFRRDDPVALACIDYGYNVVPSQSDKDENGNLLNDPFDPRCTEWLVEIPTEVPWANLPGADEVDISQFSALAQFDFYMQVQRCYTTHNTSATIEYRENEIEALAGRIHQSIVNDEGYISAALLARFDSLETFPRLPFEPIDKETYERLHAEVLRRRKSGDFLTLLNSHDHGPIAEAGPAGCDSDKCLIGGGGR